MTPADKLNAVRLLLGDDLTREIIEDQWNLANDFADPYEIDGGTARYSMAAAELALKAMVNIQAALKPEMMDLCDRRVALIGEMDEVTKNLWLKGGETPEAYSALKAAPFDAPAPKAIFEDMEAQITRLQALLEGKFEEVRFVKFENGQFDFQGSFLPIFAETMAQTLETRDRDGNPYANYAEIEVSHPKAGPMTLTLQRRHGKTPHELRMDAELQLTQLKAKINEQNDP